MIFNENPRQAISVSSNIMLARNLSARIIHANKTRQGYVRKHTLKLAGSLFLGV
jgi:hypothetical protein